MASRYLALLAVLTASITATTSVLTRSRRACPVARGGGVLTSKNKKSSILLIPISVQKWENPKFPDIFRPVGQPSLVGYPGPIQSTQDNQRPRKWRN